METINPVLTTEPIISVDGDLSLTPSNTNTLVRPSELTSVQPLERLELPTIRPLDRIELVTRLEDQFIEDIPTLVDDPEFGSLEFGTPLDGLFYTYFDPSTPPAQITPALLTELGLATQTSLFSIEEGLQIPFKFLRRWSFLFARQMAWYRLQEQIRQIFLGTLPRGRKDLAIDKLIQAFLQADDLPLGPCGLIYNRKSKASFSNKNVGLSREKSYDFSGLITKALQKVLRAVINNTLGRIAKLFSIDLGKISAKLAANLAKQINITGTLVLSAEYAQLWKYPTKQGQAARDLIESNKTAAAKVAYALTGAPTVGAFTQSGLTALEAQLSPLFGFISDAIQDPVGIVIDLLSGKRKLDEIILPEPAKVKKAVETFIENLNGIGNLKGFKGSPMRTTKENRVSLIHDLNRTIHFQAVAGCVEAREIRRRITSDEVYPISLINYQILPEHSQIFMVNFDLFYKSDLRVAYPTNLGEVVVKALEATLRQAIADLIDEIKKKPLDFIREKLGLK